MGRPQASKAKDFILGAKSPQEFLGRMQIGIQWMHPSQMKPRAVVILDDDAVNCAFRAWKLFQHTTDFFFGHGRDHRFRRTVKSTLSFVLAIA